MRVRKSVNKYRSARKFRKNTARSKMLNYWQPMRGGIRL